ncbi:MAG: TolC family protein, partial [Bacteroidota bacterium]
TSFCLLLLCCGLSSKAQLNDTLSLNQLIQLSRQQNISVYESKVNLQIAELDYLLTKIDAKPTLNGRANLPNYSRTSLSVLQPNGSILFQQINNNNSAIGLSLSQNIIGTGGTFFAQTDLQRFDDFEDNSTLYNGIPIRVGIIQPIFGFNEFKWNRTLAPVRLREANKQYIADLESVNGEATRLFFNLLIAGINLEIATANFSNNQSLFEIAEERFKLGKISNSDVLQLKVSLLSAQRNQKNAQQAVRLASSNIYAFLGVSYNGGMLQTRTPEMDEKILVDFDKAVEQARSNRPEVDGFQRQILEADQEIAATRGTGGVQADLTASFGLVRAGTQIGDIYQSPQDEQLVQMNVRVPIIDWGRQKNQVKLAKAQKAYTQQLVTQQNQEFNTQIRQVVDQFQTVQEELELAESLKEVAQERFNIAKESFVLGAISTTELSIAQQEKDQALRTYILVLRQYWQSYYQLRALTLYDFQRNEKIGT